MARFSDHAQFYLDVEGHIESLAMRHAMEELRFYCEEGEVRIWMLSSKLHK